MKIKILPAVLILAFLPCFIPAQKWVEEMQNPKGNFYKAEEEFEKYWSKKEVEENEEGEEEGTGEEVFKRWAYFVEPRVYPSGDLSLLGQNQKNYEAFLASEHATNPVKGGGNSNNMIASTTWTPMGPFGALTGSAGGQPRKSGRLNFITIHPAGSNTLWVGAPAGGLWQSTNGGTTWSTTTDNLGVIGCSDLAVDPTNTNILYLATGDGETGDTRSIGVLKSTNGGQTWAATGLTNVVSTNFLIRRLIINPSNPQILLAATNTGIYRTVNGGTSWAIVANGSFYDLEFKPGNPNTIYAAANVFRRSTDGGATWTTINSGIATTGVERMAIAVTTADTNYVYVIASSTANSGLLGFYRSTVGGTVFTAMTSSVNVLNSGSTGTGVGGQGWYDLCIAASPLNKDEVITGGVNIWRTTDGGGTWAIIGHWTGTGAPWVHADQHDLEFDASGTLFNCNDGTVYRYTGTTWQEISGTMNISEIYRIGMSSLTANKWITGHQDNGTNIWNGTTYFAAIPADGMDCFFDYTDDNNVFGSSQNGGFSRSTNGGATWSSATTGLTTTAPWLTIWKQDPGNPTTLYCGRTSMFVSNDLASTWSQLNGLTSGGTVNEFAIAPSNNQIIYVLKNNGIYKTINAGTSWTNVTGSVPATSAAPKYICVDPNNPNKAWVVLSGYSSGNKVFMTTNGGTSWTNYTANLPNLPANCVVYQPGSNDVVYVGMDVGIYYRASGSSSWTPYNAGLPNVPVSELEISPASPNLLHAATYGRGIWVANIFSYALPPVSNYSITSARCLGAPITFSDQSYYTPNAWSWSVTPNTGVAVSSYTMPSPTITFTSTGSYIVSLQSSNGNGSGNVFTQTIVINPPPTIAINSSDTVICIDMSVQLNANGATNYTWLPGGQSTSTLSDTPATTTTYTLIGTDANGCTNSGAKTVTVLLCEGIKTASTTDKNFIIFPNPTKGKLVVQANSGASNVMIRITDISGKTVYSHEADFSTSKTEEINISHLAAGTYFVKLVVEGKNTEPVRILKE